MRDEEMVSGLVRVKLVAKTVKLFSGVDKN